MDDSAYRDFFTQPTQTFQRQYEAVRAVFVDQRKQKEVAEQFGFTYGTMRQLVFDFRQFVDGQAEPAESPFFATLPVAGNKRMDRLNRSSLIAGN